MSSELWQACFVNDLSRISWLVAVLGKSIEKTFPRSCFKISSSWRVIIPTFIWTGLSSTPFPFVFEFFFRLTRPLAPKREVLSSFYCSRNWWRVGGLPFGMLDSLLDEGLVETIDSSLSARGVPQSTQNLCSCLLIFRSFHRVCWLSPPPCWKSASAVSCPPRPKHVVVVLRPSKFVFVFSNLFLCFRICFCVFEFVILICFQICFCVDIFGSPYETKRKPKFLVIPFIIVLCRCTCRAEVVH